MPIIERITSGVQHLLHRSPQPTGGGNAQSPTFVRSQPPVANAGKPNPRLKAAQEKADKAIKNFGAIQAQVIARHKALPAADKKGVSALQGRLESMFPGRPDLQNAATHLLMDKSLPHGIAKQAVGNMLRAFHAEQQQAVLSGIPISSPKTQAKAAGNPASAVYNFDAAPPLPTTPATSGPSEQQTLAEMGQLLFANKL